MSRPWQVPGWGARHGFFGAAADYATANSLHRTVRRAAMQHMATPAPRLFVAKQVHSNRVLRLSLEDTEASTALVEADALICAVEGRAVGVLTADCMPILIAAPSAGWVAAVHAGRVGALAGIFSETVAALEREGAHRGELAVVVGPHITAPSYEVGQALHAELPAAAQYSGEDQRLCCDLAGLLSAEMHALGLAPGQVTWSGQDTLSAAEWHSFRRDGALAGRNLSVIAVGQQP
jgi:YfiH family protein